MSKDASEKFATEADHSTQRGQFLQGASADGHPSDLKLDQLWVGELDQQQQQQIERHLEVCSLCQQRAELRQLGLAAFPEVNGDSLLQRISQEIRQTAETTLAERSWLQRFRPWFVVPALAAAAAGLFLLLWPGPQSSPDQSSATRTKGSLSLRVFQEQQGQVREARDGDAFYAGNRLRFFVNLPAGADEKTAQIMLLGVEQNSSISYYYPVDSERRSSLVKRSSDGLLVGAVKLDNYVGREWLHLVYCPHKFAQGDLKVSSSGEDIQVPEGCQNRRLLMMKRAL